MGGDSVIASELALWAVWDSAEIVRSAAFEALMSLAQKPLQLSRFNAHTGALCAVCEAQTRLQPASRHAYFQEVSQVEAALVQSCLFPLPSAAAGAVADDWEEWNAEVDECFG